MPIGLPYLIGWRAIKAATKNPVAKKEKLIQNP